MSALKLVNKLNASYPWVGDASGLNQDDLLRELHRGEFDAVRGVGGPNKLQYSPFRLGEDIPLISLVPIRTSGKMTLHVSGL